MTTPIFGFIRPTSDDYAYQLGDHMGQVVDRLEAVLAGFGISPTPSASALTAEITARTNGDAALSTRVTALESGGWVSLTLATGFVSYSAPAQYPAVGYRPEGKRNWMRGWLLTTAAIAAGTPIHTGLLPAALCPAAGESAITLWGTIDGTTTARRFELGSNRQILSYNALPVSTYINMESATWPTK